MIKFFSVMAGITYAFGLQAGIPDSVGSAAAGDAGAWTVFVDQKNQVWSVLESELQEYRETLAAAPVLFCCETSPEQGCTCFERAENDLFLAGTAPEFFYSPKRSRLRVGSGATRSKYRFS